MSSRLDRTSTPWSGTCQGTRHDIGEELRETIQSRIDEEAAARGRDLTSRQQRFSRARRPVAVAGRYGSNQYLIGPSLYPYYRATLKALVKIALPVVVIVAVVNALGSDNPLLGFLGAVGRSLNAAWVVFGIVTLIFWQMGRVTPHPDFADDWDPTHLPHLPVQEPATVPRGVSVGAVAFFTVYCVVVWICCRCPSCCDDVVDRACPAAARPGVARVPSPSPC